MRDALEAVEMFEALGQAVKDAGIGKYNGFNLVEALREKGFRLVLEKLPEPAPEAPIERAIAVD